MKESCELSGQHVGLGGAFEQEQCRGLCNEGAVGQRICLGDRELLHSGSKRDHRHNMLPLPEGRQGDVGMKHGGRKSRSEVLVLMQRAFPESSTFR